MRKKIIVRGPVLSRSGYGEQARFALRSLRKHEDRFDIFLINTQWGGTGWISQDDEERTYIDFLVKKTFHFLQNKGRPDISLQITIPNEWEKIAPINIGYTAGIETTKIAPGWIEKSNLMDRIIVTSRHSKNTLINTSYQVLNQETQELVGSTSVKTPVEAVGYPVKLTKKRPVKLDLETDFNFLMVSQWGPRKNTNNTIKWFVEKFKDNPDVGLVVKGFIKNNSTMDKISSENMLRNLVGSDAKCKVYFIHGDMSDQEMIGLYSHPKIKCLISLSHGEGWGLPLYEASYTGLPIVTTNWSGQCDFLNMPVKQRKKGTKNKTEKVMKPMIGEVEYSLAPVQKEAVWDGVIQADSMWCYADKDSYHNILQDVVENYDKYKDIANKLKTWVKKEFEADKQYDAFANVVLPAGETKEEPVVSFD
jgi:glycosyltransferase involved in cell wall biosynthesis|tara:strand:- start:926 stop:2188 length:1263 start_codon:yes stop_codon:yes gene_type:complete